MLTTVVIREFEKGLDYRKGRFAGVLGAGRYRCWWFSARTILRVDMRETALQISGQEVLTADNVPVRLNVLVRYRVVDPAKAIHEVVDYRDAVHQAAQIACRDEVVKRGLEAFLTERNNLTDALTGATNAVTQSFGVEVRCVTIKDAMLDPELREAFRQKLVADQKGQASLIEARHQVAAARAQANAAAILAENPAALLSKQLDVLAKAADHGYGNHFVILPDTLAEIVRKLGRQ
ncbi:MAG TPA: hypothetical protein DGT21_25435 [Armatimonadetes bacterium]|jgi:regulator of protease activity HflC (stomatin/prohibitin superfamily)|nr:hypothetical protein [Armatimonadota bacterium]